MSEVPDTDLLGCRLPFGLGFAAFAALVVLSLMVGAVAVTLLLGSINMPPGSGQAPNQPGHAGSGIPVVSDRYFATGSARASVGGGIAISLSIEIDPISSYAQDGLVWLSFIDNGNPAAGEVLVVFNEPEDSVTVANGTRHAIGVDDACAFDVQVTAGLVAGHISCASVDVIDGDEDTGENTSIQLDFSATTDTTIDPGADGGG
jgi:hypothetical protein